MLLGRSIYWYKTEEGKKKKQKKKMGCDYYYCFFLVGRELRLLIVLWSEVKDQNNRVAVFLFTSIGREGRAEEKPPTFVEVGITCLPQTLMLGKLDRCCSSSSADMDKQGIIPPARNGVRVMTVYPANLWGVSLNMLFVCVCVVCEIRTSCKITLWI